MGKNEAKRIAEIITYDQLCNMFYIAKDNISDWEEISCVNKCLTKGSAWNILFPALKPKIMNSNQSLGRTNMIREFGDFIKHEFPKEKKPKYEAPEVFHQNPKF